MLLGRDPERRAVDRLLADARLGRSGVLAIAGEPGIGKTALLDHAAEHAGSMRVLRARGIESEAEVPFASLLELLRPALGALDSIPEPQADALAAALALRQGGAQDRFSIGAATLSLLAAYAEEAPLLLLVDDAHWLDGSSAEALLFAFRRLVADPIAVLIGVRDQEPSLIDGSDLPVILLEGLDRATAAELTGTSAPELADRLYEASGGTRWRCSSWRRDSERLEAVPPGGPLPISTSIGEAFLAAPDRCRRSRARCWCSRQRPAVGGYRCSGWRARRSACRWTRSLPRRAPAL